MKKSKHYYIVTSSMHLAKRHFDCLMHDCCSFDFALFSNFNALGYILNWQL